MGSSSLRRTEGPGISPTEAQQGKSVQSSWPWPPRGISAIVSSDSFLIYLLQAPQHQRSLPAPPRGSPYSHPHVYAAQSSPKAFIFLYSEGFLLGTVHSLSSPFSQTHCRCHSKQFSWHSGRNA